MRDAERFKELVNEVREIIDSLCSVLDLGRQAHLNRQLLVKALSVDVPDGLAAIRDGLARHSISRYLGHSRSETDDNFISCPGQLASTSWRSARHGPGPSYDIRL